jgi:hypothetical protein
VPKEVTLQELVAQNRLLQAETARLVFRPKIEFAEAQAIERDLALIQRAALKDWKAAAWILERRHPDMFARPEVQLNQHVSVQAPSSDLISWILLLSTPPIISTVPLLPES